MWQCELAIECEPTLMEILIQPTENEPVNAMFNKNVPGDLLLYLSTIPGWSKEVTPLALQ